MPLTKFRRRTESSIDEVVLSRFCERSEHSETRNR